jgi:superfamily II DNA or RNA helicase
MNREDAREEILRLTNKAILLELPTGYGKSLMGMDLCLRDNPQSILIVVPRVVLIQNWKNEFKKWGNDEYLDRVTFSTYAGLHKVPNIRRHFNCVILDEAHHVTPRVQDLLTYITYDKIIMLSATVKRDLKYDLKDMFPDLYCYKVNMKEAIENEVLPDPMVYLLPLTLDSRYSSEKIVKHSSGRTSVTCSYKDRWNYIRDKNIKLTIECTQLQKSIELDNEINFWKDKYMRTRNEIFKNKWLHLAGQRLKWLSNLKNPIMLNLLALFRNERVLTFCNSIDQTIELGRNCINSKNKDAVKVLESFNKGEIRHITACNMLNEGMNLSNCRIGIYANLNSSEIIIKQRLGRILRHEKPVIVIPFYKGTREEELVAKMLEDYNPQLIHTIENITDIKI